MRRRFQNLHGPSRSSVALGAAFITLILAAVFPYVYPTARIGMNCTDLASPIGGNNRSLLAQAGEDAQNLDLEVDVPPQITTDMPLEVKVTFVNKDIGPAILYFGGGTPPLTTDSTAIGLRLEITRLDGSALVDQGPQGAPAGWPTTWVDPVRLHLLGARSRCTETINYPLQDLAGSLSPGDYRIRAFYYNNNPGILQPPAGTSPTATPAYTDQGIWIGSTASPEVRFSILSPGSLAP